MQRVPAEDFESLSVDGTADMDSSVIYPTEFLQTLTTAEMPTHRVVFKGRRAIHVAAHDKPIDGAVQWYALPPYHRFAVSRSRRNRDWAKHAPEGIRATV